MRESILQSILDLAEQSARKYAFLCTTRERTHCAFLKAVKMQLQYRQ